MLKVSILGHGHMAETWRRAMDILGLGQTGLLNADLLFVAEDVYDHSKVQPVVELLSHLRSLIDALTTDTGAPELPPIVLLSQVPPGFTKEWSDRLPNLYYQVDTIIMRNALQRILLPEQLIIGGHEPAAPMPLAYQEYVEVLRRYRAKHGNRALPIVQTDYVTAEMAKLAINYWLKAQVETANHLWEAASKVGATWEPIVEVLRNDRRIGPHAYLRPGEPNVHLTRDADTILNLLGVTG